MDRAVFLAVFSVRSAGEDSSLLNAVGVHIPKRPTAIRTFEKSCEHLCFAVLLRSFAAVDVCLCLIPKRLGYVGFVRVLNLEPFLFRLTDFLLVFERDMSLSVVNTVSDIYLVGQNFLDLCNRPLIPLTFGLILEYVFKSSVSLEVEP